MTLPFSPQPKGEKRARVKARKRRKRAKARRQMHDDVAPLNTICEACRSRWATACHHVTYRSRGGTDTAENGAALCPFCHNDVHAKLLKPVTVNGRREWQRIYRRST